MNHIISAPPLARKTASQIENKLDSKHYFRLWERFDHLSLSKVNRDKLILANPMIIVVPVEKQQEINPAHFAICKPHSL